MYKTLLPKRISKGDITIQKVSIENDNEIMNELINLFKKNAEHLLYWHHNVKEFLFRNTNDFKKHLEKNRLICYIVLKNNELAGYTEVSRLMNYGGGKKYRTISFWIDKKHIRKGLMYNTIKIIENMFTERNVNIILANVFTENKASINLLNKLKYKHIRTSYCFLPVLDFNDVPLSLRKHKRLNKAYSYYTFEKIINKKVQNYKKISS